MAEKKSIQERRQHPRIQKNIPLKISQEDGDLVTETWNISRSGAYCKVNRYIEPMTKLKVNLLLPFKKRERQMTRQISCEGIVIRTETVPSKDYYNVAIFFSDIAKKDAEAIAEYVDAYLKIKA